MTRLRVQGRSDVLRTRFGDMSRWILRCVVGSSDGHKEEALVRVVAVDECGEVNLK